MPSVKVHDYYENDENGLWSWYLRNIRSGDFEELTTNELKFTLLKRFLNSHFFQNKINTTTNNLNSKATTNGTDSTTDTSKTLNNDSETFNENDKILLISIPDNVHSDISILETFLKEYFQLDNLTNISIQKLTNEHCYNHENHYLLIDKVNNFNDPSFLNSVKPQKTDNDNNNTKQGNQNLENTDVTSILSPISQLNIKDSSRDKTNILENSSNSFPPKSPDHVHDNHNSKIKNTKSHSLNNTTLIPVSSNSVITTPNNVPKTADITSINNSITESALENHEVDTTEDNESSIVLNLSHHKSNNGCNIRHHLFDDMIHKKENDNTNSNNLNTNSNILLHANGHTFTPPDSELVSINSFYYGDDYGNNSSINYSLNSLNNNANKFLNSDAMANNNNMKIEKLTRVQNYSVSNSLSEYESRITEQDNSPNSETYSQDNNNINDDAVVVKVNSDINSMSSSNIPREDLIDDNVSYVSSIVSESSYLSSYSTSSASTSASISSIESEMSVYSILPSISINNSSYGHFRLVLQSGLLINQNKEIFTAIRQSNNLVNEANVSDDWILYDSKFSMNNLTMLTLKELFALGAKMHKILFYSMVVVDSDSVTTENDNDHLFDNKQMQANSKFNQYNDISDDVINDYDDFEHGNNSNNSPKFLYDESDDENTEEPEMYEPKRMITNTTIAHRSIRTVNSIGEWAYRKRSNVSGYKDDESYMSDEEAENNHEKFGNNKDNNLENNSNSNKNNNNNNANNDADSSSSNKMRNKTINDYKKTMQSVERWKSLPNKRINGDNEAGKWRQKMKKFKRSSARTQHDKDKICNIM